MYVENLFCGTTLHITAFHFLPRHGLEKNAPVVASCIKRNSCSSESNAIDLMMQCIRVRRTKKIQPTPQTHTHIHIHTDRDIVKVHKTVLCYITLFRVGAREQSFVEQHSDEAPNTRLPLILR